MHGLKKEKLDAAIKREKDEEKKRRLIEYNSLEAEFYRLQHEFTSQTLEICSNVLLFNPEYYTLWNWRKQYISRHGLDAALLELDFIVAAIQRNPKSYWCWYQRKWIINNFDLDAELLEKELGLCSKLLDLDSRNFHCWNFRKFVARKLNIDHSIEFEYTTKKIHQNFSNYSAWHYRSQLLEEAENIESSLESEINFVKAVVFTEPADQSPWFYIDWLIEKVSDFPYLLKTLRTNIQELVELEPESIFALEVLYKLEPSEGLKKKLQNLNPDHAKSYQ